MRGGQPGFMKNELLVIGPFVIYGYGLMIALGIAAAYGTAVYRSKKWGLDPDMIFGLVITCVLGGFGGAKILYLLTEWKWVAQDPVYYLQNLTDGFVVYGGIIGGIFAGFLYCKIRGLRFLEYFDLVMPSIALAQAFGRMGCFLAGCCYGKETSFPLHVVFTQSAYAPNGVPLIPTEIYSCLLNLLNYALLLYLSRDKRSSRRHGASGQIAAFYLINYSAGRFVMEFFRGDEGRGQIGILSTSQFISIFTLGAGILMLLYVRMHKGGMRGAALR